ncbi:MAG TPA: NAD-dependent epimerase/dehydratase family protein [Thermoanaerobaculia bacterium]|nr:NAD-dependent epimerase/dehydratase family protein [Thermoanaerobaculia bacterium]
MRLLILGGTRFLGYHLAHAAAHRHHDVTLFNRGKHAVVGIRGIDTIIGDRNTDLGKLQRCEWDAVIDTSGYLPRSVKASAEALAAAVERYIFVSSLSVYKDCSVSGIDETAPLAELTSEQLNQANAVDTSGPVSAITYGKMYGGLKVLCEQAAEDALPNRVLTIRPGVIVGAYDYTDRLTYWAVRVAQGGEVLAPGPPQRYVQFIDVRDVADWIIQMAEQRHTGIYNATGPREMETMAGLLEACRTVSASDAHFTWASEQFLLGERVTPWTEMPLWLPEDAIPHMRGFMAVSSQRAVAAGLHCRSLDDTIDHTSRWYAAEEPGRRLRAGLEADRERQLLQKWHSTK